jgi:putative transposase
LVCHLERDERLALVEREHPELPLTAQADLLSLSRSSLYYHLRPPSLEEVAIKHRIDALYTQYPFYGSRRITAHLRREGLVINRKAVQRHMREMGIAGIAPGPHLSRRDSAHRVYPYLLRDVPAAYPNHVWGIDITYVRLYAGWLYLVAVLDWYSRYVVSWELDQTLALPFVLTAVERSLAQATPVIWNSDQGSHYTSRQISRSPHDGRRANQHGREGAGDGQHLRRASVAHRQVRGSLSSRLRQSPPGASGAARVHDVL